MSYTDFLIRSRHATQREFVRFSLSQRIEHLILIISFTALAVTGLPQKFHETSWAILSMNAMGGIEMVRLLHRFFAVVFVLEALYHLAYVIYVVFVRRGRPSMMPGLGDARDAIHATFYGLGLARSQPRFDRYDFRQKFEYWGLVWGGVIMIITGLVIWFPVQASLIMPGVLIPAAKAAHGGEALLAVLTIVTWHFYWAHMNPHSKPLDKSIFTGKLSAERMIEEHPLEYERLVGKPAIVEEEREKVRAR